MPRYYFDVHTTERLVVDEVGEDLENPDVAVEVAIALLQCTELGAGGTSLDATVRDHTGRAVLIVSLEIRVQRYAEEQIPVRQPPATPVLIERSRALLAHSRRATAELDQAVLQSGRLLDEMKRRLVEPGLLPATSRQACSPGLTASHVEPDLRPATVRR